MCQAPDAYMCGCIRPNEARRRTDRGNVVGGAVTRAEIVREMRTTRRTGVKTCTARRDPTAR